ncbi:hypothetical protein RF11_05763 [Thelohanellus kitauei]|uniref:Uncharacterized protein n=1 Tax=Thelohanellus kitauei TaxID=669202 RepID=A0A0C2MNZ6_THEKT|nr:hypothetical protein RF11_05763 [Thelohanellus kitauei]
MEKGHREHYALQNRCAAKKSGLKIDVLRNRCLANSLYCEIDACCQNEEHGSFIFDYFRPTHIIRQTYNNYTLVANLRIVTKKLALEALGFNTSLVETVLISDDYLWAFLDPNTLLQMIKISNVVAPKMVKTTLQSFVDNLAFVRFALPGYIFMERVSGHHLPTISPDRAYSL